jgi:transposase InsO family protein
MKSEGTEVARCTLERLMSRLGLSGAVRGKGVRTTIPTPNSPVRWLG